MFGNHGQILMVDLTTGQISRRHYDEEIARKFLGGNGLAAKLISDEVPPDADPLGAESAVVFAVGPITGTPIWGTSRGHTGFFSPLTGLFADSNFGGKFGTVQKRAGLDAIFITGRADRPVYLLATPEGATLKDADALWGKTTDDTFATLEATEGEDAGCAVIGPAGENRVLFANVMGNGRRSGAAGRAGLGAVLGAKMLKAIVVRGHLQTPIAHPDKLNALLKQRAATLQENSAALRVHGTPVLVNMINGKGMLCTRNNSRETFEYAQDISGELIRERYRQRDITCPGCPVACGKMVLVGEGLFSGKAVKMPEFETLYALGSMLDNRDLIAIFNANHLCDLLGMDTISLGVTLSFVAECLEKGIVSEARLGGVVRFADGPALAELVRKTAFREGIGDVLAQGSWRLARQFGGEAERYLYAAKGLEIAGHSARGLRGMSLSYATSTRGGSHHDGRPKYLMPEVDPGFEPQPEYIFRSQHFTAVGDSLVLCRFTAEKGFGTLLNEPLAEALSCVTGWRVTVEELERIGERIYNLERLLNVRRGVRRKDDTLPYRVLNEPIPAGPAQGRYCPKETLDAMLDRYYQLRGWSADGVPHDAKLAELGLK